MRGKGGELKKRINAEKAYDILNERLIKYELGSKDYSICP